MTKKQLRQTKFMLRQGFSAGCQHQEEFVATKKLLSRQMKQAEIRNLSRQGIFCHDTYHCNMKKLIETEEQLQRKTSVMTR